MRKKAIFNILILATVLAFLGCASNHFVQIVDSSGNPIAGAEVRAVTLSMNLNGLLTDQDGKVFVPASIGPQDVKWIEVIKPGYNAVHLYAPKTWPLVITLSPGNSTLSDLLNQKH